MRVVAACERDADFRVDTGPATSSEIWTGFEGEPVDAGRRILGQSAASTICVCDARGHTDPPIALSALQPDGDAGSRFAQYHIQNMRRDRAHEINHFPRRI